MTKIASKFTLLESRIASQSQLHDRVTQLESKHSSSNDLHSRLAHLESKIPNHTILSDRLSRLESKMQPDPEHDRLITRINAKLDIIENSQKMKLNSSSTTPNSAKPSTVSGSSIHCSTEGPISTPAIR